MATKIKIDLAHGLVEVEGSEEFVRAVYADFKDKLSSEPIVHQLPPPPRAPPRQAEGENAASRPKSSSTSRKRSQSSAASSVAPKKKLKEPSTVKTLDLSNSPAGRLRDFYDKFDVKTNYERNLIFIYFLQQKMEIEQITQDHVYTCYRNIPGIKVPGAFRQSLLDTESSKDWIDAADADNLKITVHGLNYLEHDMPKKIG
jgi:hypothetical protein